MLIANCQLPVASFATVSDGVLTIDALVASIDGKRILREQQSGLTADAEMIGQQAAQRLLDQGAGEILGEAQT